MKKLALLVLFISANIFAQKADPYKPDFSAPAKIGGMKLVWNDEFNNTGAPDSSNWSFEKGFVRNEELQWYSAANARCGGGVLLIEGKKERVANPGFIPDSKNWREARQYAGYTSASIKTAGHKDWLYGTFLVRARIDTSTGAWPAIWLVGTAGGWPRNGEIDMMEFYRIETGPVVLANVAWAGDKPGRAKWNDKKIPLAHFTQKDPDWVNKFHIWKMEWDSLSIKLYLDDELLNTQSVKDAVNPDGNRPFTKPQLLILNLALGQNGGDPSGSRLPIKYEIDYARVYQKN